MKKFMTISFLFLLLIGTLAGAQDDTTAQRVLIERFYREVYTNGDISIIPDLVAKGYIDHNQARWPNRAGIAHIVVLLHTRLPDLTVGVDKWYFRADHVVVRATFSGTLDGKPIHWVTLDAYRIEGGRLAEAWHLPPPNSRSSGVRL